MIDINKYQAIALARNLEYLKKQMIADSTSPQDINEIRFPGNVSLLEAALSARRFDIANYLLDMNAPVNVVTDEHNNELSIVTPWINDSEALMIAERLVKRDVDLTLADKKFGNPVLLSIVIECVQHINERKLQFMKACLDKEPNIFDLKNKRGVTIRMILSQRKLDYLMA